MSLQSARKTKLLCIAVVTTGLAMGGGCPRPDGTNGTNGKPTDQEALLDQLKSCGTRTVTIVPSNTYVEMAMTFEHITVTSGDSPLAKVVFPSFLCWEKVSSGTEDGAKILLEVDANSRVTAMYVLSETDGEKTAYRTSDAGMRFVLEGGR